MTWRGWCALGSLFGAAWVDQLGLSHLAAGDLYLRAGMLAVVLALLELAHQVGRTRG